MTTADLALLRRAGRLLESRLTGAGHWISTPEVVQLTCESPRVVGSNRGHDTEAWRHSMPTKGTTILRPCDRCGVSTAILVSESSKYRVVWCHACVITDAATRQAVLARTRVLECGCCRGWGGYRTTGGYGIVALHGQRYLTHRLVWEMTNGPIPDGLYACHDCPCGVDRRECCEPSHIFLGTSRDNMQDAARKGRTLAGSRHPFVKISIDHVNEIRRRYATGETQRALAREFSVAQTTISALCRGKNWSTVPSEHMAIRGQGPCRTCGGNDWWYPHASSGRRCRACRRARWARR